MFSDFPFQEELTSVLILLCRKEMETFSSLLQEVYGAMPRVSTLVHYVVSVPVLFERGRIGT